MEVRRPRHATEVGDLPHVGAIELHREDVGEKAVLFEAAPKNALAVGREERPAVIAGRVRQTADVRAVGVHQVQLAKVRFVHIQPFLVLGRKFVGVCVAV